MRKNYHIKIKILLLICTWKSIHNYYTLIAVNYSILINNKKNCSFQFQVTYYQPIKNNNFLILAFHFRFLNVYFVVCLFFCHFFSFFFSFYSLSSLHLRLSTFFSEVGKKNEINFPHSPRNIKDHHFCLFFFRMLSRDCSVKM